MNRFAPALLIGLFAGCAAPSTVRLVPPTDSSVAYADSVDSARAGAWRTAGDLPAAELTAVLSGFKYTPAEIKTLTANTLPPDNPDRLWKTKNHVYGFIPPRQSSDTATSLPVQNAFDIEPDTSLAGDGLRLSIDRLRVKKYPGKGTHNIAFFCSARTQVGADVMPVEYGVGYSATEGDHVAAVGITMFEGVRIVGSYVNLGCGTTNVDTQKDKTFFSILADNLVTQGLKLLDTVQPALQPLTALARGVRQEIENQHKGIPVEDWKIGLDLSTVSTRIKLREGSYLVIQIPAEEEPQWNWARWEYRGGRIQQRADSSLVPYNYIVIGVSR